MTTHFPIVFEREDNGAVSAYVVGLPVYAQYGTHRQTARAIRSALALYLAEYPEAAIHPPAQSDVQVAAVTCSTRRAPSVTLVSAAALLGQRTSRRKAASSRANGRLGGRPRHPRASAKSG